MVSDVEKKVEAIQKIKRELARAKAIEFDQKILAILRHQDELPAIYNWSIEDYLESVIDNVNDDMIARDGDPSPMIVPEPAADTRGEPFRRANKFTNVQSMGRWWVK